MSAEKQKGTPYLSKAEFAMDTIEVDSLISPELQEDEGLLQLTQLVALNEVGRAEGAAEGEGVGIKEGDAEGGEVGRAEGDAVGEAVQAGYWKVFPK